MCTWYAQVNDPFILIFTDFHHHQSKKQTETSDFASQRKTRENRQEHTSAQEPSQSYGQKDSAARSVAKKVKYPVFAQVLLNMYKDMRVD
jgi:hypothetical protein